jgi:hypothetical protein
MKKYFEINCSTDPKLVGVRNGEAQLDLINDEKLTIKEFLSFKKYFHWGTFFENVSTYDIPDLNFELNFKGVNKLVRYTDFISYSPSFAGIPFLVNQKALSFLQEIKIQQFYVVPANIFTKDNTVLKYWLIYLPYIDISFSDFNKSIFFTGDEHFGKKEYFTASSFTEYCNKKLNSLRKTEKIVLKSLFDSNLDVFQSRMTSLAVSQNFKDKYLNLGLTGLNINIKKFDIEIEYLGLSEPPSSQ